MAVDWLDPICGEANLERMSRAFDEVASMGGADLVVFPELVNQGYVKPSTDDDYKDFALAYRRCAEKIPGPFTGALGEMAKANDCYVVAGMAEAHPRRDRVAVQLVRAHRSPRPSDQCPPQVPHPRPREVLLLSRQHPSP